jgi:hypothetical protein
MFAVRPTIDETPVSEMFCGRYRLASGGFRRADLVRFRCTRVLCEADSTRNWSEKFGL